MCIWLNLSFFNPCPLSSSCVGSQPLEPTGWLPTTFAPCSRPSSNHPEVYQKPPSRGRIHIMLLFPWGFGASPWPETLLVGDLQIRRSLTKYDLGDASRTPGGRPGRVRVRQRSPEASRERPSAVPGPKLDTKSVQFWLKSRLAVLTVLTVLPDPGARAQTHTLGPRQRTGPP